MRRRKFLLGGAAAWPLAVRAQQIGKVPRIGCLSPGRSELPDPTFNMLKAFQQGLHELGYTEGQNLAVERRCRQRCGWNLVRRDLRSPEGIVSGCEVNWLIDGLCGERLPAIDFAHVDLA